MIYFPFTSNRFGELYGLANIKTLGYFLVPYYIVTRVKSMPIKKRLFLSSTVGLSTYYLNKYIKSN